MTDLEMTRLAAKAIGLDVSRCKNGYVLISAYDGSPIDYEPRTNKAQAFELLEKLRMLCMTNIKHKWVCRLNMAYAENDDLKHAIVECAANYQLEKEKQA